MKTLVVALSAVLTAAPPAEFGSDWDNPRTAVPPIPPARQDLLHLVDWSFKAGLTHEVVL
jgi:hypothetical protein